MAGWPPIKNGAFTLDFVFRDADGDLSTAAAALTSIVSLDEGAFSSGNNTVTNEGNGFYSLALDAAEMNADRIMVSILTTSTGIKPAAQVLYTSVVQVGTVGVGGITSTSFGAGAITSTAIVADAFIAEKFATDALTTASIAAGVFTKVWAESTRSLTVLGVQLTSTDFATPFLNSTHIGTAAITSTHFGIGAINSTAIADAAITSDKFAANAISSGVVSTGQMEEQTVRNWDRILTGATHNIQTSAGRRLRQIEAAFDVHAGTAQGSTAGNTITLDLGASSADNIYRGDRVVITEGAGAQEHGIITAYAGATRIATMAEDWLISPTTTSLFELVPADVDIETWQHVHTINEGDSSRPSIHVATMAVASITSTAFAASALNSTAIAVDAITADKIASSALTTDEFDAGVFTKIWAESTRSLTTLGIGIITSTSIADDAITSAKIATDALTTNEIADGVFTKVWAESTRSLTTLGFTLSSGDFGAGALSTENIAQGVFDKTADAGWDEAKSGHVTAGSFGEEVQAHALSAEITALNDLSAADVNAEVVDVVSVDTFGEPLTSTSFPGVTATITDKLGTLQAAFLNRLDVSSGSKTIYTSAGAVAFTKTLTDTGVYSEAAASTA